MNEQQKHPVRFFVLTGVLLIGIYLLVWYSGGTCSTLPHLFYIPIIYTAILSTWYYSALTAIISGLLLSEWLMPLDTHLGMFQDSAWIYRLCFFLFVSLWTSFLTYCARLQAQRYQAQLAELAQLQQASVSALVDLTEMRDKEVTGRHLDRLGYYADLLCSHLKLDDELRENIVETIALHDIGKVAVPDSILKKPGSLDPEEWVVMKKHPIHGAEILDSIAEKVSITDPTVLNYLQTAREIILHHHEKYDGSGYPYGLAGDEIPLSARVAAICDVYDSLRSVRPYKEPFSHEKAVEIIRQGKGTHFDPILTTAFEKLASEFAAVWDQYGEYQKSPNV